MMSFLKRKILWVALAIGLAWYFFFRKGGTANSSADYTSAYRKQDAAIDRATAQLAGAAASAASAQTSKAASYVKDSLLTPSSIW